MEDDRKQQQQFAAGRNKGMRDAAEHDRRYQQEIRAALQRDQNMAQSRIQRDQNTPPQWTKAYNCKTYEVEAGTSRLSDDQFALQDEVVKKIIGDEQPRIEQG